MPTIARVWRGATPPAEADAYHEYLLKTGVPDAEATPGNKGVFILRRVSDGLAEFLVVSLWESMEAVRRFAGERLERPVRYAEDAQYLEREPTVRHYEVLLAPDQPGRFPAARSAS